MKYSKRSAIVMLYLGWSLFGFAQVGLGTRQSQAVLHIDGKGDNQASLTPEQTQNDVVVTKQGYMGMGLLHPRTRVDMRAGLAESSIGIGDTKQTAAEIGPGAIRYNRQTGTMEESVFWLDQVCHNRSRRPA